MDHQIINLTFGLLSDGMFDPRVLLDVLDFFRINTIGELKHVLASERAHIVRFAEEMVKRFPMADGKVTLFHGSSIFFMGYWLAASADDPKMIDKFLENLSIKSTDSLSAEIRSLYAKIAFSGKGSKS
jgi:hypothetical protein